MTPSERLASKIANERLKLFASLLNSLAAPASVGALIAPSIVGMFVDPFWSVLVAGVGCLLHVFGHVVLDFSKSEQSAMATVWLVPLALGTMGLGLLSAAWLVSRRFDRKYPHLSRKGMREAEERERAGRAHPGVSRVPVPPFHAEDWNMRSARDEAESERLDRSIHRWRERMTARSREAVQPRSDP